MRMIRQIIAMLDHSQYLVCLLETVRKQNSVDKGPYVQSGSACLKNLSIAWYELSCKFITSPHMWRRSGLMVNGQLCDQKNLISFIDFR